APEQFPARAEEAPARAHEDLLLDLRQERRRRRVLQAPQPAHRAPELLEVSPALNAHGQVLLEIGPRGSPQLAVDVSGKHLRCRLVIHACPQRVCRARYSLMAMRARCKRDLMVPSGSPETSPISS